MGSLAGVKGGGGLWNESNRLVVPLPVPNTALIRIPIYSPLKQKPQVKQPLTHIRNEGLQAPASQTPNLEEEG